MRSLFLITNTNELQKYVDSLRIQALGETDAIRYDDPNFSDAQLIAKVREWKPDFVVYIGSRWGRQPSISCLSHITAKIAPMVHLCSDAADHPWFDLLREYNQAGCFALQVAIDGSQRWPLAASQMTALTPVDPANFSHGNRPHRERGIIAGYGGNAGGGPGSRRTEILSQLLIAKAIDLRARTNLPATYEAYCDFLQNCRMCFSTAYTGTEASMHVKGRVIEAGLAGSLLLETKGSPTSYWFRPGVDYLEYEDAADAVAIIQRLAHEPEKTQSIAFSLRKRVLAEHTPAHFWNQILSRVGLKAAA